MSNQRCVLRFLTLFVVLSLVLVAPMFGQETKGTLVGTVKDQTGGAIPGAEVTVTNQGTGRSINVVTSDIGTFVVRNLTPGVYRVQVALTGFKTYVQQNVKVNVGEDYSMHAVLEIGDVAETVTVVGGADLVNTSDAQVSTTIEQRQIQDLPLNGRNPMALITLQAGTAENGNSPTSISGMRVSFTNITQDGINIQDNFIRSNATTFTPNRLTQSMVSEFSIATAGQNVGYGFGSSQVNFVTPSGTNDLHGEVYWFHRNNKFAANGFFPNKTGSPKPKLIRNQFGVTGSGPIIKDKLLWYANYEGYRDREEESQPHTILLPDARQGIFKYEDGAGVVHQANLLEMRGLTADPTIQGLLSRVPTAGNDPGSGDGLNTTGYRFNMTNNEDRDQVKFRLDYILNGAHSFEGIYSHNKFTNDRPDIYTGYEKTPLDYTDSSPDFLSTAWNWTISPSLINQVRFGFNFAGVVFETLEDYSRGFKIGVNSFTNPDSNFERQGRDTNTYNVSDNASWTKGAHSFRFGFQQQNVRIHDFSSFDVFPTYYLGTNLQNNVEFEQADFPGLEQLSSTDRAAFLNMANNLVADIGGVLDEVDGEYHVTSRTSGFENVPASYHWEYDIYAFYFGDTWRISPRLTFNAGLRWELYRPLRERDGLITEPIITNGDYVGAALDPNNSVDFVTGDLIKMDKNNLAPNFGLAWDVFGDGKTAVRAGYSVAYVNDEMQRAPGNAINRYGVTAYPSLINLTGTLSGNRPTVSAPAYKLPLSWTELSNPSSPYYVEDFPAPYTVDPNMVTPYAQSWNLGIEHEIGWDTAIEARYVGTKGTKLSRAIDYNQMIILENGILNDFRTAQNNAALAEAAGLAYSGYYNPDVPGSAETPVMDTMPYGGLLDYPSVTTYLRQGKVGQYVFFYKFNDICGPVQCVANPVSYLADALGNGADSVYHSLQIEARRRFQNGLQFQANYTFGKTLTNASGAGQTNFEPALDIHNLAYDRGRASYGVTHVFNANFMWELPFGQGKRFEIENGVLDQILGGWEATSIFNWQSGDPFSIMSNRGTVNRDGRSSGKNRASTDLSNSEIRNLIGVGDDASGPTFINPDTADDGTFYHPAAGELGSLGRYAFDGPSQFHWDLGIMKRFNLFEDKQLEFKAELFNATNHTNFNVGSEDQTSGSLNLDSSSYGRITAVNTAARITQFSLRFIF